LANVGLRRGQLSAEVAETPGIDDAPMADDEARRRVMAKRLGDIGMIEHD